MEKEAIKSALEKTRGSKRTAARLLNISERTLYRKIKEYDLVNLNYGNLIWLKILKKPNS